MIKIIKSQLQINLNILQKQKIFNKKIKLNFIKSKWKYY